MFKINLKDLKERINDGRHPTSNEGMYLVAYIERLTRLINNIQWSGGEVGQGTALFGGTCPYCFKDEEKGHDLQCEIGDIIKNSKGLLEGDKHELEQEGKT